MPLFLHYMSGIVHADGRIFMRRNFLPILCFLMLASTQEAKHGVIATIGVGDTPAGLAITPDNRFAYIANNNNDGIPGGDSVSVIDLKTNAVIKTISDASFNEPYTVTINAAGTKAYVTNSNGATVTIIDIATNTVIGVINGFDGPSGFVITPDGNTAYVNNYGGPILGSGNGKTVSVVNLNTNAIIGEITVGLAPASLAITPDGKSVYTINYVDGNPGTGTMSIIQTSTNTVVGMIHGFSGPFSIVITPNGKFAYVTNFGSNNFSPVGTTVSVVNLKLNIISTTIKLGTQPSGIALTPDGRLAYVTIYNTLYLGPNFTVLTSGVGVVNIIDTCTNKVLSQQFVVGASPANIAISPNGKRAYVTNYRSNTVSVINIFDKMWLNLCRSKGFSS
jgi:YVTN family beta-propeller protein